jgi:hypothetical protein
MMYATSDEAASRLAMSAEALRCRCRRGQHRNHLTGRIEADIGDGIVAVKIGRSWRVKFPERTEAA